MHIAENCEGCAGMDRRTREECLAWQTLQFQSGSRRTFAPSVGILPAAVVELPAEMASWVETVEEAPVALAVVEVVASLSFPLFCVGNAEKANAI